MARRVARERAGLHLGHERLELGPVGGLAFFFDPRPPLGEIAPLADLVADAESIDEANDRLLAIAAIGLRRDADAAPHIDLADSFEAVLRQDPGPADKDNILLHGIGVGEQAAGEPAADVLTAFERWLGDAPLIAFHAAFDQAMIGRAMKLAKLASKSQHESHESWVWQARLQTE